MKTTVLCVGKIKESYLREAIAEYSKRLSRYVKLDIIEVPDEKTPENASAAEEEKIKEKEGARLLAKLPENSYVIALAIEGKSLSSTELSSALEKLKTAGNSHITFIIGGSLGLSKEVLSRADKLLSFSAMTFPHQLMRVILLEQLYRTCRITAGEPYHK